MTNSCFCCGAPTLANFGRRRFLQAATLAGFASAVPVAARPAEGRYEAMLLSCIDPRMVVPVYQYMGRRGLTGSYSQFVIAGAAVAVVAPKFAGWHETFWQNLAASIELHRITRVIAIDHRDCGAVKLAYGAQSIATPVAETATHKRVLGEFRKALAQRYPQLAAETGLMALDGSFETLG
jgi:carbonic anhydrase